MTEGPYGINTIITGDAFALAELLPDESVNLILADPVYWELGQYAWLVKLAERVLVPGGNLVAQTGNEYTFKALQVMADTSDLVMRPLLIETFSGGGFQAWNTRAIYGCHPYVWMTKGSEITRESWVSTCVRGGGRDKSLHEWGDTPHAFLRWIQSMTVPDDVVLDPFCGSGTVPAACKSLGRFFIAFEIDPTTAEVARARVRQTQPPLFVLEKQQEMKLFSTELEIADADDEDFKDTDYLDDTPPWEIKDDTI